MVFSERFRTAELHGEERGIKIGEGRGIKIGEEQGKHARSIEVAKNMLMGKLPLDQVAYYSGLTIAEIEALAKNQSTEEKPSL